MKCLRTSLFTCLSILALSLVACGSAEEGFDPNESDFSREIREKVRVDMAREEMERRGRRLASLNTSLENKGYAYKLYEPSEEEKAALALAAANASAGLSGLERGGKIYVQNCSSCHGERGAGDGPLAATLVPKPSKHSDGSYMNALSNGHIFKVIKEGGAAVGKSSMMAPWGTSLSDAEIRDVVEFVRSLATPAYEGETI